MPHKLVVMSVKISCELGADTECTDRLAGELKEAKELGIFLTDDISKVKGHAAQLAEDLSKAQGRTAELEAELKKRLGI